jgi:hypothetical protein
LGRGGVGRRGRLNGNLLARENVFQSLVLGLLAELVDARGELAQPHVATAAVGDDLLGGEQMGLRILGLTGEDDLKEEEQDDQA